MVLLPTRCLALPAAAVLAAKLTGDTKVRLHPAVTLHCITACRLRECSESREGDWQAKLHNVACALPINSQEQEVACMVHGRLLLVAASSLLPSTAACAATLATLQSRLLAGQGSCSGMLSTEEVSSKGGLSINRARHIHTYQAQGQSCQQDCGLA